MAHADLPGIVSFGDDNPVEVLLVVGDCCGGAAAGETVNYTGMGSAGEPPMLQECPNERSRNEFLFSETC